jgi:hypothetical protein
MIELFKSRPFAMTSVLMCLTLFSVGVYGFLNKIPQSADTIQVSFYLLLITGMMSWCAQKG